ncbi:MAG: hypothetical protein GXO57_07045 [Thermodesulfobacteria bacterium]|nr:hypothetical protein [Thermodesulfobacteriota bacterium]
MKITPDKILSEKLTDLNSTKSVSKDKLFESYFKHALEEIEKNQSLNLTSSQSEVIYEKLNHGLKLLEKSFFLISQKGIKFSEVSTISDYLISQAKEINELIKSLPESSLKKLFKEFCLFLGVEAQKLKQMA